MAKRRNRAVMVDPSTQTTPLWPTTVRSRRDDGRIVGTDGSVWLYRKCPMAPVPDARTPEEGLVAGFPLLALGEELAAAVNVRMARRSIAKSNYRDLHILLVNIPALYRPAPNSELAGYLSTAFADETIDRRILVVGVRLRDKVGGGGGLSDAVDSVVQTLSTGTTPMSDFDADYATVDAIMSRSGMTKMTGEDFRLVNAWWNWGSAPDTPMLVHTDHLHIFGTADSARAAAALDETDCVSWPALASHHTISMGCVQDFDLPYVPEASPDAQWATDLVSAGAVAVSIRGKLEPASVTRGELRRNKKKYLDDIRERAAQGKMERAEQEEMLQEIADVESVYATGGPATMIDCSTVVVFAGRDPRTGYDLSEMGRGSGLVINSMVSRQNTALAETWLASPVRSNPYLHDLPIHAVSSSGIAGLSMVGDATGALLGFTERDRQPAYVSPTAASDADSVPLFIGVGQSGSGKAIQLSTPIPTPSGWTTMGALSVGDEVFGSDGRPCRVTFMSPVNPNPVLYDVHFSDGQVVTACKDHQWLVSNWQDRAESAGHTRSLTRLATTRSLSDHLCALASRYDDSELLTANELLAAATQHPDAPWATPAGITAALDFVDCPSVEALGTRMWAAPMACKSLAVRVEMMFAEPLLAGFGTRVLSTEEMLANGIHRGAGRHAEYGIHVIAPLDLPAADLPFDPYTLGTRQTGHSAHIPLSYLRASAEQRLAFLQGLMDAVGEIDQHGCCELHTDNEQIADEVVELVRSLGIKAHVVSGTPDAVMRDPKRPHQERRRATDVRWRIRFTTNAPVFRRPRKLERISPEARESQQWLYITDIVPVPSQPARCITVDSPDHTYLVHQFIPTHNTVTMLYLADQFARTTNEAGEQRPVVIVDPKALALDTPIPTPTGWVQMGDLRVGDEVFGSDGAPCHVTQLSRVFEDPDLYEVTFDDGQVIRADADHQWAVTELVKLQRRTDVDERREQATADAAVILQLADNAHGADNASVNELFRLISTAGCRTWRSPDSVARALRREGCLPLYDAPRKQWNLHQALKTLHVVLERLIWSYRPGERVMTTAEMVAQGVKYRAQCRFAIKTAAPFEMPDVALPVDPYILGVWLGDGSKSDKSIACGAEDVDEMVRLLSECWPHVSVRHIKNRRTVVLGDKHIPEIYQRASVAQRLALLQGLMDTDGTVKRSGSCRLVLTRERLITDALELIRGLGYKATFWAGPATITEDDPDRPGEKRRRTTGTAYYINFKTSDPVFRLPRKLALLPKNVPVQSKWHYIKSIEPVESTPARCIVVDSPDHTYLAGQFIPTHNSGSDHSAAVLASGGRVQSLDELTQTDGVFDPIRFAAKREVGAEMAATMLLSINPFGEEKLNYETPLLTALSYGIRQGADCIGVALRYALDAGEAPKEMVDRVFDLAAASPMFRACVGLTQGGLSLRTAGGITLIKVGDSHLDLPEPGSTDAATQPQRVALALVRMIVFGSAMALTGRQGVLMLDEAWVMLSAGKSEIERLGRLARSQQVLPMLWTQRITDATNAGLSGYISRGLILPIQDPAEARAACSLFRLEDTPERMGRITAKATIGGNSDLSGGSPNWGSMRALRDRETGRVLRGAVGIYVDLAGRAVPTEIKIPPSFFTRASTNPEDIRRRRIAEESEAVEPVESVDAFFEAR